MPSTKTSTYNIHTHMNIITNIKEFVFKQIQKRNTRSEAIYPDYSSISKVLILFESDVLERNVQLKQLVKEIQADGKTVTAWGYVPKKDIVSGVLRDYRVLGLKDVNFLEVPKEYEKQDIQNEHFDLLIDLNMNDLLPLRYLAMYANADFRAGKLEPQPYVHDFMIDVQGNDDPAYLFDQILAFLKKVKAG